jgi:hypothetical protein
MRWPFRPRPEGAFRIQGGRCGTITYADQGRVLELYFEISGVSEYDILVSFGPDVAWSSPVPIRLTDAERTDVRSRLDSWLREQKIRALVE